MSRPPAAAPRQLGHAAGDGVGVEEAFAVLGGLRGLPLLRKLAEAESDPERQRMARERAEHLWVGIVSGDAEREQAARAAALRLRSGEDLGAQPVPEIAERIRGTSAERSREL